MSGVGEKMEATEKKDIEMEDAESKKVAEKAPVKTEEQILLEKLTFVLTRDFPQGVQGDQATLGSAVESFYYFRKRCQNMGAKGLAVLDTVMKAFTGSTDTVSFDDSTQFDSATSYLQNLSHNTGSILKTLEGIEENPPPGSCFVECAAYLALLATVIVVDANETYVFGYDSFTLLWLALKKLNRRSTDMLSAKVCFFRVFFHAKITDNNKPSNTEVRANLLQDYRTCVLNHNEPCQAVITNLILQKYLEDKMISQAAKFCTKANIPERSDPYQIARYSYYVGRINVVQMQYGEASSMFRQALRKAPRDGALGFKHIVTKYLIVTMLLMGDIPERGIFRQEGFVAPLQHYLEITQAVRVGNVTLFQETLDRQSEKFENDGVYMLILRLRHNVIKAALRKISVSYSRIHLSSVAEKLNLSSALEAEYITAKAIKDGVIDAVIHHQNQEMRSTEVSSVYSTKTPQQMFDSRIQYALSLHQKCVKALRFKEEEEEKEPEKKKDEEDGKDVEDIVEEVLDQLEKDDEEE